VPLIANTKSLIRNLLGRERADRDTDEELRSYLDLLTEEKIASGLNPTQARRQADIELGGLEQVKENVRDVRATALLDSIAQDVRYALRTLRRAPAFTAIAVLTLALGIGANTAIYSVVYTLILRSFPVQHPEQLVELLHRYPGEPRLNGFSRDAFQFIREHNDVLAGLVAVANQPLHLRSENLEPQTVEGAYVDANFFRVLGVDPALGRRIEPEVDAPKSPNPIAVISWSFWETRLNLDPAILGKQVVVDETPVTVVGVTPKGFSGLQADTRQDIWLPLALRRTETTNQQFSVSLFGRLKPGVSLDHARSELAVLWDQSKPPDNPFLRKMRFELASASAGSSRLRDEFGRPMLALLALVGLLLLIACSNVAGMLLARGASREREMAVRVSLGAGRARLMRQVLTESLLLSAAGGALGVWFAYFAAVSLVQIILTARTIGPPLDFQPQIDAPVLIFTAVIALSTGAFFGMAPAMRAGNAAPSLALSQSSGGQTKLARRFEKSLVIAQVTLSVILLSAAALFVRHLSDLRHLDVGFNRDNVLQITIDPAHIGLADTQISQRSEELLKQLESLPGIRSASLGASTPISGAGASRAVTAEGHEDKPGEFRYVTLNWIAPNFFETLGTPLLAGRDFNAQDQSAVHVAIVNQSMARYYFGDESPLGKHITFDRDQQSYEIVGEVADAKYYEIREPVQCTIYLNAFQNPAHSWRFIIHTAAHPMTIAPAVRREIRESLGPIAIRQVTTLTAQVDASIVPERLTALVSGFFGALGALLAAIGLYGLLAYSIARRIHEIGVRMALGASPSTVVTMVIREATQLIAAGLAVGIPTALVANRLATHYIPDLPSNPTTSIAIAAATILAAATLAIYIPAHCASRLDPATALRHE
jgi:predicted permease